MSATTMIAPRRVFGVLDDARLAALQRTRQNYMNKQLGAAVKQSSWKQNAPAAQLDQENVNPAYTSVKRKRSALDEEESKLNESPKALKTSREEELPSIATVLDQAIQRSVLPSIKAIKPVGRSPVAKSFKPFARRPGKHALSSRTNSRWPGLDRRASRTTTTKSESVDRTNVKLAPITPGPSSWFFDIYVDTAEDEATNAMHHSTGCLDISDDEEKKAKGGDDRGKENIPPHELGITLPTSSSATQTTATSSTSQTTSTTGGNNTTSNNSAPAFMRKILMAYEQRAPLAELKASDYYAAGLHALSYAVILEDDDDSNASAPKPAVSTAAEATAAAA